MNNGRYAPGTHAAPAIMLALLVFVTAMAWWGRDSGIPDDMPQTPTARGRMLAQAQGCIACHSLTGANGIGPSWKDSYGAMRMLKDGTSVVVNEDYLRRAMRDPAAQVVTGYENVMLPVALPDDQVADLIEFIRELSQPALP